MTRPANLRGFFLWMAVFAVLMAALAPALAATFSSTGGQDRVPVCTPLGERWVRVDAGSDGGQPTPDDFSHLFEHCPCCGLHAALAGMHPPAFAPVPAPRSTRARLAAVALAPVRDVWSDALWRGPPRLG